MHIHRVAAFTENDRGGNPAGVVLTDHLPEPEAMQRIAAEVGYSETAFAARQVDGTWRVRYFSPESEVPFCGHATIGLGAVLGQTHGPGRYPLTLNDSAIEVVSDTRDGRAFSVLRSPATHSAPAGPAVLAQALELFGYAAEDLDPSIPPRLANGGASHLIIALKDRAALAAMDYDLDAGRQFMRAHDLVTVDFVVREHARLFHSRNAFASGGVLEDPATGAAAAALAGMLRDMEVLDHGDITILQGADMGRPSRIEVTFTATKGDPVMVRGACAAISEP